MIKSSRPLISMKNTDEARDRIPDIFEESRYSGQLIQLSKKIRDSSEKESMLERVKQSYFSEEYELGLSLLSKKDELSHTEKIWKIRLLSAMRLFDDVVLLLSETDIPNSPINVIGAFSTALVDSDFQQDFISCIGPTP